MACLSIAVWSSWWACWQRAWWSSHPSCQGAATGSLSHLKPGFWLSRKQLPMETVDTKILFYLNIMLTYLIFIHSRNIFTVTQTALPKVLPAIWGTKINDAHFNIFLTVHPFIYSILITIFQTLMNLLEISVASVPSNILPDIIWIAVMDKGLFLSNVPYHLLHLSRYLTKDVSLLPGLSTWGSWCSTSGHPCILMEPMAN